MAKQIGHELQSYGCYSVGCPMAIENDEQHTSNIQADLHECMLALSREPMGYTALESL